MMRRIASKLWMGVLLVAFQAVATGAALAHSPTITASAVCSNGQAVINYTVGSWTYVADGENSRVDVLVNGVVVGSGALVLPTLSFSGSVPAPAGTSATVTALAVNAWGDGVAGGQSASTTVTIPSDCAVVTSLGRFTGGGSQITVGDVRITKGLTIHCDLLLSNNLEVNWGGHQFHMEEHITTVECSDDPNINQQPPAAPLDTLIGIGVGSYDGSDGFTIQFTLVDAGEPGTNDSAALLIYETANPANIILNLPLTHLSGGNLQAHFDQPHKK